MSNIDEKELNIPEDAREEETAAEAEMIEAAEAPAEAEGTTVTEEPVSAEDATDEAASDEAACTGVSDEAVESIDDAASQLIADEAPIQEKPKKPFILQTPVIIALCIVIAALLGYFGYTAFLLHEPEGITWSATYDDITYYYEFENDGTFKAYVGSVELTSTFEKQKADDKNYIVINADAGDFYSGQTAEYEITGSRILKNQVFNFSYGEDQTFTLTQVNGREDPLDLPDGFEADEAILGEWVFNYYGYEYCKVNFNDDGTMRIEYTQNGIAYNGTYTIEDGNVNFTYFVDQSIVQPIPYSIDGETLTFMEMPFTRPGAGSTADEAAE